MAFLDEVVGVWACVGVLVVPVLVLVPAAVVLVVPDQMLAFFLATWQDRWAVVRVRRTRKRSGRLSCACEWKRDCARMRWSGRGLAVKVVALEWVDASVEEVSGAVMVEDASVAPWC